MYSRFCVIGTSDWGPEGTVYVPATLEDLMVTFGWERYEVHTVAAGASSITPDHAIEGNGFEIWQQVSGEAVKTDLYRPSVTDENTISFISVGVSGTYAIKYTPKADENNLILGALDHYTQSGRLPHVIRLPGTRSSVDIGDYTVNGKYSGSRCNGITVTVGTDSLVITDPNASTVTSRTYSLQDSRDLFSQINSDASMGMCPVTIEGPNSSLVVMPSGTYTLASGSSAAFTVSGLTSVLDGVDLDEMGYVVVPGGISHSDIEALGVYLDGSGGDFPVAIVGLAIGSSGDATSLEATLTNWTISSDHIIYAAGWAEVPDLTSSTRWTAPSCILSGLLEGNKAVHSDTILYDIEPVFSEAQLKALRSKYALLNQFIQTGLGFFSVACTSETSWFKTWLKEYITSICIPILEGYVGKPTPDPNDVAVVLSSALVDSPNARDMTVKVRINRDTIEVDVVAAIFGEVTDITLTLVTRR